MKLEDATKDELIWWINKNQFQFKYELKRFTSDIFYRRSVVFQEKAKEEGLKYLESLEHYKNLLKPYAGRPVSAVPNEVLHRIEALEREIVRASNARNKAWETSRQWFDRAVSEEYGEGI